jgi:hypothetical protein
MGPTATYAIELFVGLTCLGLATVAWARGGIARAAGVAFAVAGVAAVAHAAMELVQ